MASAVATVCVRVMVRLLMANVDARNDGALPSAKSLG
jgi:hypothetical protein